MTSYAGGFPSSGRDTMRSTQSAPAVREHPGADTGGQSDA